MGPGLPLPRAGFVPADASQHLHLELTGLARVVSKDPSCSNILVFEADD